MTLLLLVTLLLLMGAVSEATPVPTDLKTSLLDNGLECCASNREDGILLRMRCCLKSVSLSHRPRASNGAHSRLPKKAGTSQKSNTM